MKKVLSILILISSTLSFSQTDTTTGHGKIKIAKPKSGQVYIKATCTFDQFDTSPIKYKGPLKTVQPFPLVPEYDLPFNYTRFFNEKFRRVGVVLNGKEKDTVVLKVIVLAKGKVYIKDQAKTIKVGGTPAIFNESMGAYELNMLHLDCINQLRSVKEWVPAYAEWPKKTTFKKETVIKPETKNVDAYGTITIYFSTEPFED